VATCLTVAGVILDDVTLELDPGFLVSDEPTPPPLGGEDSPDALIVRSVDERGRLLDRAVIASVPICLFESGLRAPRLAAGLVPFVAGTRTLLFVFHDRVLHEVPVLREGPRIELRWQPAGAAEGLQVVEWDAEHPDGAPLAFLPLYRPEGGDWQPLGLPQPIASAAVDFDALPGGDDCRIRVLATDGVNTATVDSDRFAVRRKGLQPVILAPDDGAVIALGAPVTLTGQAFHWEEPGRGSTNLRWRSSRDGELGVGPSLDVVLSPGDHTISVTAVEAPETEAFVTVEVLPDPCRPAAQD
jgi:hypothetical protein